MSQPNIIISPKLNGIVNERIQLWESAGSAAQQAKDLEQLGEKIGPVSTVLAIEAPLTLQKSPPQELANAFSQLQAVLAEIETTQSQISAQQDEIKKLEAQARQRTILAILAVLLVVVIFVFMIMGRR